MAAGLGFKTFTTGEVLTAADTNGYLMQGINVFANSAARATAITSPQEGQYSYLKDTNALEYYDGAAWVGAPVGDITAVTAGKGLTGGGSSGDVTVSLGTTAKGDLVVGTGTTTAAALTVGSDGSTIVADSAATTGLRYSATPSASNPVINSAFQVWQRGTSMAGGANGTTFCADRWNAYATGSTTFSRQVTGDTTNLPNIQYCARVSRDSGNTSTGVIIINQNFETVNTIPFVGKTVTMSFYARKGANYSMASSNILSQLSTGTGTDQSYITTGYTGEVALISQNSTLTTTWQRFSYTATVASNVTEMSMQWRFTPVGTAGAADYFEITGVQLDIGSVALPFRTYAATIQGETSACQRYCQLVASSPSAGSATFSTAFAVTSTTVRGVVNLPVPMRTNPTVTASSGTNFFLTYIAGGVGYYSTLTLIQSLPNSFCWAATLTAGSHTAGQSGASDIAATATAGTNSVILSAEL